MSKYDVAAIIWPSYTGDDPRARLFWPEGYGEWQSVKAMPNKGYAGCRWPRKPLWGYVNEADSDVMEMQINTALRYGVNTFIYDWYWYDNRPFLENCLNDGFLKARNNRQMKFYLMWANHDANYLWDIRNSHDQKTVIWKGAVNEPIFDEICDRTIEKYFKQPNYYQIDGCPVYMIFNVSNLLQSFPSIEAARKGLERFRAKTVAAGFKGLHLQLAFFYNDSSAFTNEKTGEKYTYRELMETLGFDSFTNYNWACVPLNVDQDYRLVTDEYLAICEEYARWRTPFYPNLTVGWDNNIRFREFVPGVMRNNTPEAFEAACERIRQLADRQLAEGKTAAPLITVNSWNEWTETSYLEPDDLYGYGYLEAIKKVFDNND